MNPPPSRPFLPPEPPRSGDELRSIILHHPCIRDRAQAFTLLALNHLADSGEVRGRTVGEVAGVARTNPRRVLGVLAKLEAAGHLQGLRLEGDGDRQTRVWCVLTPEPRS